MRRTESPLYVEYLPRRKPTRRTIALFSPSCHDVPVRALLCFLLGVSTFARDGESPATNPPSTISHLSLVRPARYTGMCDASGAVTVSSNLFVDRKSTRLNSSHLGI